METLNLHPAYVSSRDISPNNAVTFVFLQFREGEGRQEGKKKSLTNIGKKTSK